MIYHLNDGGTMACVAPHGVLFRGSDEGKIRQFLIEKRNYIDAIIGLPANFKVAICDLERNSLSFKVAKRCGQLPSGFVVSVRR